MFNFENLEEMINEVSGLKHFADVAEAKYDVKESKNKAIITSSYMGLTTKLIVDKNLVSIEDNTDMEYVLDFIKVAKPGSNIIISSNIGDINFEINSDLVIYVDNSKFNAVMEFKNKKAKELFFGLRDLVSDKLDLDQFQELVNSYYYSIK